MLLAPDGTAIASTERAYATGTTSGESGLSGAIEQQPGEWLDAFIEASHDLLDPLGTDASPAGIALSGQMHNAIKLLTGKQFGAYITLFNAHLLKTKTALELR